MAISWLSPIGVVKDGGKDHNISHPRQSLLFTLGCNFSLWWCNHLESIQEFEVIGKVKVSSVLCLRSLSGYSSIYPGSNTTVLCPLLDEHLANHRLRIFHCQRVIWKWRKCEGLWRLKAVSSSQNRIQDSGLGIVQPWGDFSSDRNSTTNLNIAFTIVCILISFHD